MATTATKKTPAKKTATKTTTAKKTPAKKTTAVAKTTEKALPSEVSKIVGIFDPIDFEKLNSSISKLAASNKTLSADEKNFAIGIIDEWDKSIINAIDEKIQEGRNIEHTLNPNMSYYNEMEDEMLEALSKQLGAKTSKLFKAYLDAKDALFVIERSAPEGDQIRNLDETAEEYLDRQAKFSAESAKYQLKLAKARKNVDWALYNLKKELQVMPEVQEILKRIKTFTRKQSSFKKACEEKSRLAKINITISDDSVREALKELINFTI